MRAARPLLAGALSLATAFTGVALAPGASAAPITRYVAKTGTDTENDCSVKTRPCLTIEEAVNDAAAGDTVSIAAGRYAESAQVLKPLTLAGDPNGGTIISGQQSAPGSVFVFGSGFGGDDDLLKVTLRDLDISGNASGPGVIALLADLTVERTRIDDNFAVGMGLLVSEVRLEDSTVSSTRVNNPASEEPSPAEQSSAGSGIASTQSIVTLTDSTVAGNGGAGIVQGLDFPRGRVAAAALPEYASTVLTRSTVSGNGFGGLVVNAGPAFVGTSTVSGNDLGGIVALSRSGVSVTASTIAGTRTIGNATGVAGLVNATDDEELQARMSSAMAGASSALARATRAVTPISSAVVRRASARVVAAAPDPEPGVLAVQSSAVIAQAKGVPDCAGPIADAGYNASSDASNSCAFSAAKNNLVKIAPKVGPLADNGGPTKTHLPLVGSPLLNKVPAAVSGDADQRGVARPQGVRSDIGAVEAKLAPVRITTKSLPDGQVGDKYSKTLAATGGDGDYAWSLAKGSSLPDGLKLSRTGVISGTPTESGKFTITVLADGASKRFTLEIDAAGAAPNGDGQDPIAETGAASASLMAWGSALLLAGFVVMLAAGHVGRRPGRHRTT